MSSPRRASRQMLCTAEPFPLLSDAAFTVQCGRLGLILCQTTSSTLARQIHYPARGWKG